MEAKKWYTSKTILVQVLAGLAMILSVFSPPVADFLKVYFAEAGSAWALINIVLRLVTRDKVEIK